MEPSLIGVGVGPGAPDLITVRALSVLRKADKVFGPTMAENAVGRAESILREAAPEVHVERLIFAILGDEHARTEAHNLAARRVIESLEVGETVAFITLGDPNIYSTFFHLAAAVQKLRPNTPVETVPGIMAFQDLAALSKTFVVDGVERLHLISAVDGVGALDKALLDPQSAVVMYKGGRYCPEVAKNLTAVGRLDGAVYGELLGLPGERVGPLKDIADRPAAYLTSIIIPPVRDAMPSTRGEAESDAVESSLSESQRP